MLSLIDRIKNRIISVVERYPASYYYCKRLPHHFSFLLPHDPSYLAFKYLAREKGPGAFIDIGANDGISALSFRRFNKNYSITSFEPNPFQKKSLARVTKRIEGFSFHSVAIGDQNGSFTLHVPHYGDIPLHSYASLSKDAAVKNVTHTFSHRIGDRVQCRPVNVEVVKLDDWKLQPDIIKIDAEGNDARVLQGLENTIRTYTPHLFLEATDLELIGFFESFCRKLDYNMYMFDYNTGLFCDFQKQRPKNLICVHKDKIGDIRDRLASAPANIH